MPENMSLETTPKHKIFWEKDEAQKKEARSQNYAQYPAIS